MYDYNRPHGIMYHYFHNDSHPIGQGSIDSETFRLEIKSVGKKCNLLSADDFYDRFISGKLRDYDVCITFDENLRCQIDIALPVLKEFKLKAFWFINTSPFDGTFEELNLYRYFRSTRFKDFNDFYYSFLNEVQSSEYYEDIKSRVELHDAICYLSDFPCYSDEDRIFRYIRDKILSEKKYFKIMNSMINKSTFMKNDELHKMIWMDKSAITELHNTGHLIGLHSHTHPTDMGNRNTKFQYENYKLNKEIIEDIINDDVVCMSHPNNSYNNETLSILKGLGIRMGFRSNLNLGYNSELEIPRIEHSDILRSL
ncbi:MAG: polysaccharide deacetylase family protein [Bacteroidales bacterium]|nr:polysaccharide deacetylase family protein [Bacteroidales bacterium]